PPICSLLLFFLALSPSILLFFFNDPATPEIYTLSLHDALPIFVSCAAAPHERSGDVCRHHGCVGRARHRRVDRDQTRRDRRPDRFREGPRAAWLRPNCRPSLLVAANPGRPRIQGVPRTVSRQVEPGALLLGW